MISIVMPVRNASKYLDECLLSIQNQSITDWELIAINDHSTDNSLEVLQSYSESDERVSVLNTNGKGIIDALSFAFSRSKGEFITRMDADDRMAEDKLELMSNELESNLNSIITTKVSYFSEGELGDGYIKYENWLNQFVDNQNHYDGIYQECVLPSPSWMMTKATLELLGGFKGLQYPEDYDLCFKAYQVKIPIIGIDKKLHFWRDYSERTSRHDPNYADNSFLNIKTEYFLKCDMKLNSPLILWGAGKKGKKIAQILIEKEVEFIWATNNLAKLKVPIYNKQLVLDEEITNITNAQVIIAIADKKASEGILKILQNSECDQIYYFC
jgi:glycosyltransferase involved in cell wall biosynthesis